MSFSTLTNTTHCKAIPDTSLAPLTVSASNVSGNTTDFNLCGTTVTGNGGGNGSPNTQVSGGSGNYSYLWERTSVAADSGPWSPNSTSTLNPSWSGVPCSNDTNNTETWRITVTDSVTTETAQTSISVTLTHTDLS